MDEMEIMEAEAKRPGDQEWAQEQIVNGRALVLVPQTGRGVNVRKDCNRPNRKCIKSLSVVIYLHMQGTCNQTGWNSATTIFIVVPDAVYSTYSRKLDM